jgi:hypothetical protein
VVFHASLPFGHRSLDKQPCLDERVQPMSKDQWRNAADVVAEIGEPPSALERGGQHGGAPSITEQFHCVEVGARGTSLTAPVRPRWIARVVAVVWVADHCRFKRSNTAGRTMATG